MITVRRGDDRVSRTRGTHEVWHTFGPRGAAGRVEGLGGLTLFDEERLPPSVAASGLAVEAEVLVYICEGSITFRVGLEDVVLVAGTFLHQASSRHLQQRVRNASTSEGARVFRIGLRPSRGARPLGVQWSRVGAEQGRGGLRVVASEGGRDGSLDLSRDLTVYSSVLEPGRHVAWELGAGRGAWLHVVAGRVQLGVRELRAGDGAGLFDEPALSFTALEETEVLVVDLPS